MLTTKIVTNEAPRLWNCLNGIISVYKPTGVSMNRVQSAIVSAMCRGELLTFFKVFVDKKIIFRFERYGSEATEGSSID